MSEFNRVLNEIAEEDDDLEVFRFFENLDGRYLQNFLRRTYD